jgi:hypothetical protein
MHTQKKKSIRISTLEMHSKVGRNFCLARMIDNLLRTELETLPPFKEMLKVPTRFSLPLSPCSKSQLET